MGKVSGSYESVVRGVSEQNPQARRSGQHFAQVNMISDPVRGLARRHGSILQHEIKQSASLTLDGWLAATASSRVFPFFVGAVEYDLIVRTAPDGSINETFAMAFNKDTRQFIPVVLNNDVLTNTLVAGGVSAVANVGRFLYLAGNTIIPGSVETARWADPANQQKLAAWVRTGAYSRTFTIVLTKLDGTTIEASYETMSAEYPGVLDTSDIPATIGTDPNPEYQKDVNDRTNEFNGNQTAWIIDAAKDITPENIAQKLAEALITAGASGVTYTGGYVVVNSALYKELTIDDSGDGSLVRSVGNTIKNVDLVSSMHFPGKIVRAQPDDKTGDPLYLEAFPSDESNTGFGDVYWRETAGYLIEPTGVFCMATVEGGTMYIAGSAAALSSISGVATVPDYETNHVGDAGSTPAPAFIGQKITYMGVFQDRLFIGSGGNLFGSRTGDYLNWFRNSVLTVQDDDPVSGYALGSENDTIRYGALYDRSLLLYGERFQYVISGRSVITPNSFNVPVVSAYRDAVDAEPRANGNFVFYAKYSGIPGKEITSLHQVQPGLVTDVSDSYEASQQLDTYLAGKPVEIMSMTAPNFVFLRTDRDRRKVFVYNYLDNPNTSERLYDSWSNWEWVEQVGSLFGISSHGADVLMYMVKDGLDTDGNRRVWLACEKFVRDSDLSDYPYGDSLRLDTEYTSPSTNSYMQFNTENKEDGFVAVGRGPAEQFIGDNLTNHADFIGQYPSLSAQTYVGWTYPAYTTPTNPYVKDRNGQAILGGRLTIGRITVSVTDTSGMQVTVSTRNLTRPSLFFTGRILGAPASILGTQPVVTTSLTAAIGGEVNECTYTLSAIRWLPLTINTIAWRGQWFYNTRSV